MTALLFEESVVKRYMPVVRSHHAGLVQAATALAILYLDLSFMVLVPPPETLLCVDVVLSHEAHDIVLHVDEAVRCSRSDVIHPYHHLLDSPDFQRPYVKGVAFRHVGDVGDFVRSEAVGLGEEVQLNELDSLSSHELRAMVEDELLLH